MTKEICVMRHIENIPIVGLALSFTTLTRKTRNARSQGMSAMAGFWAVCILTTRKNKLLKHGTGGLTMANAVLISIRPEWVEKIANEEKTIEVRKTKPHLETPFKCYIYCTNTRPFLVWGDVFRGAWVTEFTRLSGYGRAEADRTWDVFNGHVAGEFVCDWVETIKAATEPYGIYDVGDYFVAQTRLVDGALWDYGKGATLYGWHISKLEIYDTPKPLSKFKGLRKTKFGYAPVEIKRPPQSWCYVEEQ
nr:MAG TPA: helix-turn-helix domain-containing protein [Caudoviricetes sp.]